MRAQCHTSLALGNSMKLDGVAFVTAVVCLGTDHLTRLDFATIVKISSGWGMFADLLETN